MPITVQCSGCGGRFRAPDELSGKKVKCPKCSAKFILPTVTKQSPSLQTHNPAKPERQQSPSEARQWFAMLANGQQYGPFTKSELDRWVRLREFNPPQRVRRAASQQWELANSLYPELAEARNKPAVDLSHLRSVAGLFDDFLSSPSLRQWEFDAIEACRIGSPIRDGIAVVVVYMIPWFLFFWYLYFTAVQPSLQPAVAIVLFGVLIAVPSVIAYLRCTVLSVLLTAIIYLTFTWGIIPIIATIFLFCRLGQIQRVWKRFPMSFPYWRRTKKSLDAIKKHPPREWLDWTGSLKKYRKTPLRLRLFDNAALVLYWEVGLMGQVARAIVIDRLEAGYCRLSQVSNGEQQLTGFAASADITMRSLPLTSHIAKCWTEWCAEAGGRNSSA